MKLSSTFVCPVCGGNDFYTQAVLWPDLVNAWQLTPSEVSYIDRQQGLACVNCGNNLRAMALASAILNSYDFQGYFVNFCSSKISLKVLEINQAANLTKFLGNIAGHKLVEYPEYDMQQLDFSGDSFDLVVHSDTLEHVPDPIRGLAECRRVLKPDGKCIFTVPIIVNRMNRTREGLTPSYHGSAGVSVHDQLVYTEFGADFWKIVIEAGFRNCNLFSFEYPAALAVIAKK